MESSWYTSIQPSQCEVPGMKHPGVTWWKMSLRDAQGVLGHGVPNHVLQAAWRIR